MLLFLFFYPVVSHAAMNKDLLDAVNKNDIARVRTLLKKGADVNAKSKGGVVAPLHLASANGNLEIVSALVEKGADVNIKNNKGMVPLYLASQNGHAKVVDALLKKGADVN